MKAQLSFDFYFSLIVFVMFVSSLFFKFVTFFPFYSDEIANQRLRLEAYQISEILINDAGYPGDWYKDVPNAKRLGLSDETKNKTNLVSISKMAALDDLCKSESGYNRVLALLDINDGFLAQLIKKSEPPSSVTCLPADISAKISANMTRIVAFDDGSFGELAVKVWKK